MTNIPPCIAVVQRWNSNLHGISSTETPYVNYMETKYLLSWDTHYYDSDTDTDDEGNSIQNFLNSIEAFLKYQLSTKVEAILKVRKSNLKMVFCI